MNLKLSLTFAAAVAACGVYAQDEETASTVPEMNTTVVEKTPEGPVFFTLPLCRRVEGDGEVQKPGQSTWEQIEEGRFYPLGSSYRAKSASTITIAFGKESLVKIANGASFSTRSQILGSPSRTIVLTGGEVTVQLPTNIKPGLFVVTTPGFTVRNPAGESNYIFKDKGDGFEADVRCITGSIEVEGRHFTIPSMHAADAFTIRASGDGLETVLYGRSGDYVVRLDRGLLSREVVNEDASMSVVVEPDPLDWHLSVATRVQINRAVPSIGSRMSVTMMTFDSAGSMKNHFAFTEGCPEVNTGELIPKSKADNEEIARRAAEVTTEAVAAEAEDLPADSSSTESSDDDF